MAVCVKSEETKWNPHIISLLQQGKIVHLDLGMRYQPYRRKAVSIENICGKFVKKVDSRKIKPATVLNKTCMGWQHEVYNIHGNATFSKKNQGKMVFKGCRNYKDVQDLGKDLSIQNQDKTVQTIVHMAVFSAHVGQLLDVSPMGLVETMIEELGYQGYRSIDGTNAYKFSLNEHQWKMVCEDAFPRSNDWTMTTRGSVVVRLTWDYCEWSQELEDSLLEMCEKQIQCITWNVNHVSHS
jgi:hypothetical protein